MIQVSIIVATYNSDPIKLCKTLTQAVAQQGIEYEIIVTDDGSTMKDFSWLYDWFKFHGVEHYKVLENLTNMGTVCNLLSALRVAKGEYVFFTSPGDYLFDNDTLADFYSFAKKGKHAICFGNAIYYQQGDNGPCIFLEESKPAHPEYYARNSKIAKLSFFGGNWINGSSFFRERGAALKYIEKISCVCKFLEDNSSSAFALADGERICYYDRNITWYEYGTGVSTSNNKKWDLILKQDINNFISLLKDVYPYDRIVDFGYMCISNQKRLKRFIKHPMLMLLNKYLVLQRKKSMHCSIEQIEHLKRILEN